MPVEPNNAQPPVQTPPPAPEAAAPGDQSPPASPPAKPEKLPDSYWDPTTGLRTNEVAETLAAFEADRVKQAETFKDFPKTADKAGDFYKLPEQMLPEGVKLPDGVQFKPNTDLLTRALPVLHQHRADPALFQDLTRAFNAYELDRYQKAATDFAADNKKLGANADVRRADLGKRIEAAVGAEKAKFIDTHIISAAAVEFFETLFKDGNVAPLNPGRTADPAPQPTTVQDRWYAQPKAS
jgi:hypothetical protein